MILSEVVHGSCLHLLDLHVNRQMAFSVMLVSVWITLPSTLTDGSYTLNIFKRKLGLQR